MDKIALKRIHRDGIREQLALLVVAGSQLGIALRQRGLTM